MEICTKCNKPHDVECFIHDSWCSKCDGHRCPECEEDRRENES